MAPHDLLEIELSTPEDFLKIRETLTRIGVASHKRKILYPSCNILHKKGRYFIVSFFELFELEGKPNNMTSEDVARRNTIAKLLEQWGLCKIVKKEGLEFAPVSSISIIAYKDKKNWAIEPKYRMISDRKKNDFL